MLSIGDFARYAGVSVRMLRHYDAEGLLPPAHVDPVTGYRSYTAAQFPRVNRLVALKDLGLSLAQVGRILDGVGPEDLREMLRLRQQELTQQVEADTRRLAAVRARLRTIESEGTMSDLEFTEKPLPAVRLAAMSGTAAAASEIGPVVGPLFTDLGAALGRGGVTPAGLAQATYEAGADGVTVTVGWPTPLSELPAAASTDGARVVDLPAVERALTTIHRGAMVRIGESWQALAAEVDARGEAVGEPGREVYHHIDPADPEAWVTELQQPVATG